MTSDLPRALRLAQHAVAELREVVRAEARPTWRRDLASARVREAALLLAAGDVGRARDAAGEAERIAQQLLNDDPRNQQTSKVLEDARGVLARSHAPPH